MRLLLPVVLMVALSGCSGSLSVKSVLDTRCVAGVACGIPDGFAFAGETIWAFGATAIRPLAVREDGDWEWSEDCGKNGFPRGIATKGEQTWLWCDQGGAQSLVRREAGGQTATVELADSPMTLLQLVDDFVVVGSEGLWAWSGTAFEKIAPLPETYDGTFGGGGLSRTSLYYGYFHWNGSSWQQIDPYPGRGDSPSVGGWPRVVDGKLCLGGQHLLDGTHWTDLFAEHAESGTRIGSLDCRTLYFWKPDEGDEDRFVIWKGAGGAEPVRLGYVPDELVREQPGSGFHPVLRGTLVNESLLLVPDEEHLYELELE